MELVHSVVFLTLLPGTSASAKTPACAEALADKKATDGKAGHRSLATIRVASDKKRCLFENIPACEGHITDDGFVFDYNCGQEVTEEGSFEGVILSNDIIPDSVNLNMRIGMDMIGNELYSKGYRGVFDVDFAAGQDGNLYILESNARMTGGTHVYNIMSYLGISGNNAYVISNDSFRYNMPTQKPEELLARLSEILYPVEYEKRGVVISFVSLNMSVIGIIIIGQNKKDALSLMQGAKDCLAEH